MRKEHWRQDHLDEGRDTSPFNPLSRNSSVSFLTSAACPFCLYEATIQTFILPNRFNKPSQKCKCPECKMGFYLGSLIAAMSLEDYANWIVNYPYPVFWSKCNFEVWVKRLFLYDAKREFWTFYNVAKSKRISIPR